MSLQIVTCADKIANIGLSISSSTWWNSIPDVVRDDFDDYLCLNFMLKSLLVYSAVFIFIYRGLFPFGFFLGRFLMKQGNLYNLCLSLCMLVYI